MVFIFKYNNSARLWSLRTRATVRLQSRMGTGDPERPTEVVKPRKFNYSRTGKMRVRGCFAYRGQRKAISILFIEKASLCTNDHLMTCSWGSHLSCFCCRDWTKPLPVPWRTDPSICISGLEYPRKCIRKHFNHIMRRHISEASCIKFNIHYLWRAFTSSSYSAELLKMTRADGNISVKWYFLK
jgi:hypothetical protein